MNQDNKTSSGAPSSDTTSALFVSARKKQLEQQEAERKEREKEELRRAAEAEVRRLEQVVEERRRNAEIEARRVEAEVAEKKLQAEEEARYIAEEARAKQLQAAVNPDSILGAKAHKRESKHPKLPVFHQVDAGQTGTTMNQNQDGTAGNMLKNNKKKILLIISAAAVAVVSLIVILVLVTREDKQPVKQVDNKVYNVNGSYFLEGDTEADLMYFDPDGFVLNAEGDLYPYIVSGDVITIQMDNSFVEWSIVDEETLKDKDGNRYLWVDIFGDDEETYSEEENPVEEIQSDPEEEYYVEEGTLEEGYSENYDYLDDAPEGYHTFYDPTTGLKLYYPDTTEALTGVTGDNSEIVAIRDGGNYLFAFNINDIYYQYSETDDQILSALMAAIVDEYFATLFGSNQGIVDGSVQNQNADLQGEDTSIALARMNCTVMSNTQEVYVYGELTRVDKQNLIVLTMTFRQPGNNNQLELYNDVMNSMQYVPLG